MVDNLTTPEIAGTDCASPELYLKEIHEWVQILSNQDDVSFTTVHDIFQECGMTYEQLHREAAERDEGARAQWLQRMRNTFFADQFIAVDETSKDGWTIYRHYGRVKAGQRAAQGQQYTMVAALSTSGYSACDIVEGPLDGNMFYDFVVERVLPTVNPFPGPRSILLMDDCLMQKSPAVRQIVEDYGCLIMLLPPYSDDFNPIGESFSAVKAYIRRNWRRFHDSDDPITELLEACSAVTAEKACGWFRDAGYVFQERET